jgi:hypothetical protein
MTAIGALWRATRDFPALATAWRPLRGSEAGREALLLGNSPAVLQLDRAKVERWIREGDRAVIFVNGFLSAPAFDVRGARCYFVLQDPDSFVLLRELNKGRSADELSRAVAGGEFHGRLGTTSGALDGDIRALAAALALPDLTWCVPLRERELVESIGVRRVIPLSRAMVPDYVPLWIRSAIVRSGMAGPDRFNPVSASTVEWAALMALALGFERTFVIGHRDVLDYSSFRMGANGVEYNYRYYWDDQDRWLPRPEPYDEWLQSLGRMLALAVVYERHYPGRIRYLARHHLFYPFTSPDRPDVLVTGD